MEVERQEAGRWHFSLGPVEKWVVGIGSALLVAGAVGGWAAITGRQDQQSSSLNEIKVQQAVMNAQLVGLNTQLSDVPGIRSRTAENSLLIERNTRDIAELRQEVKGRP